MKKKVSYFVDPTYGSTEGFDPMAALREADVQGQDDPGHVDSYSSG